MLTTKIWVFVIVTVVVLEVWGMSRFYFIYPHLRYSLESFLIGTFLLFGDWMTFKGMFRTMSADPGYLIPLSKKEEDNQLVKEDKKIAPCSKCGVERAHFRVNHCSRCNRCVDYMDHHCIFTDNCIAKKNFRFFFQFVAWADFTLIVAVILIMINIETRNYTLDYGAKGIRDAFN